MTSPDVGSASYVNAMTYLALVQVSLTNRWQTRPKLPPLSWAARFRIPPRKVTNSWWVKLKLPLNTKRLKGSVEPDGGEPLSVQANLVKRTPKPSTAAQPLRWTPRLTAIEFDELGVRAVRHRQNTTPNISWGLVGFLGKIQPTRFFVAWFSRGKPSTKQMDKRECTT